MVADVVVVDDDGDDDSMITVGLYGLIWLYACVVCVWWRKGRVVIRVLMACFDD